MRADILSGWMLSSQNGTHKRACDLPSKKTISKEAPMRVLSKPVLITIIGIIAVTGLQGIALPQAALLNTAAAEEPLSRISFGSCAKQDKPQPIWDAVVAGRPELFIFLGDNIYGEIGRAHV